MKPRVLALTDMPSDLRERLEAETELEVEGVLDLLVRRRWPEHLVVDPRNLSPRSAVSTGDARE